MSPRPPSRDELALEYPFGEALPAPGATIEIRPGLRWLRMGLPFALDHINLWLLEDQIDAMRGWTAVDCGIDNPATRGHWEQVLAGGAEGRPLLRVLCTHMHPDHVGLAHWLCGRFSTPRADGAAGASPAAPECRLWMSATDWYAARLASQRTTGQVGAEAAAFFASHGLVDETSLAQVRARENHYASLVPEVPRRYARLLDGQLLALGGVTWRCIAGYGHAPEHMALFDEAGGVLVSGDMVLPRISTNVSVWELEPEADPLPLFLASLERLRELPADTLVLPSHGRPFRGLHTRIAQLQQHHEERLAEVRQACTGTPRTAFEMLPLLFKRALDLHQTTFAMGEAVAHLHLLWGRGELRRERGADGIWRFEAR